MSLSCGLGQHLQDTVHSFSLYGPPSQTITYIYIHKLEILKSSSSRKSSTRLETIGKATIMQIRERYEARMNRNRASRCSINAQSLFFLFALHAKEKKRLSVGLYYLYCALWRRDVNLWSWSDVLHRVIRILLCHRLRCWSSFHHGCTWSDLDD